MITITPAVVQAIEQIRISFAKYAVEAESDGAGGAYIVVRGLPLGPIFAQGDTWIGFQITFQYPYADVYPHFARPDLARADGRSLGAGLGQNAQFRGQPATQISRRSNKLNPATDTACQIGRAHV